MHLLSKNNVLYEELITTQVLKYQNYNRFGHFNDMMLVLYTICNYIILFILCKYIYVDKNLMHLISKNNVLYEELITTQL